PHGGGDGSRSRPLSSDPVDRTHYIRRFNAHPAGTQPASPVSDPDGHFPCFWRLVCFIHHAASGPGALPGDRRHQNQHNPAAQPTPKVDKISLRISQIYTDLSFLRLPPPRTKNASVSIRAIRSFNNRS